MPRPARTRPARPARPAPVADPARQAAYDVLRAVDTRAAYANLALPRLLRERGITGRDAAFATELTYGTLRGRGTLDAIIAACSDREPERIDPPVLDLLRLGGYQLLRTRVPAHAGVDTTVNLARVNVGAGPARFVNAVLRRVTERDLNGWIDRVAPPFDADPIGHLAVRHSHPEWVVAAFRDALGGDLAETASALAADEERPPVHLVARPGRCDRDELADRLGGEPGPYSPLVVRLAGGDPADIAEVRDGRAHVQDEGSALCAAALANAPVDRTDDRWLDLCAGPGGKAALLGAMASERDSALLAVEVAHRRATLVRRATRSMPVTVVTADGAVPAWRPGGFDRVLVDAPCTGLGALRRRPEARWNRQPSDVPALTRTQRTLLTAAFDAARPGGLVGYVTCSPHLAETRAVVGEVARRVGATPVDARPYFPGVPDLGDGPYVQLWPHRHGTDAMFCALLRRPA